MAPCIRRTRKLFIFEWLVYGRGGLIISEKMLFESLSDGGELYCLSQDKLSFQKHLFLCQVTDSVFQKLLFCQLNGVSRTEEYDSSGGILKCTKRRQYEVSPCRGHFTLKFVNSWDMAGSLCKSQRKWHSRAWMSFLPVRALYLSFWASIVWGCHGLIDRACVLLAFCSVKRGLLRSEQKQGFSDLMHAKCFTYFASPNLIVLVWSSLHTVSFHSA